MTQSAGYPILRNNVIRGDTIVQKKHLFRDFARVWILVVVVLSAGCLTSGGGGAQQHQKVAVNGIRLYCGSGVRGPVSECLAVFREQTGIAVDVTFGPSGRMFKEACQQQGDVYLAGDIKYIQDAEKQGRVLTRCTICSVVPVLGVPRGNPKRILRIRDLCCPGVRFYLVDSARCQQGILGEQLLAAHSMQASTFAANRVANIPAGEKLSSLLTAGKLDAALIWAHGAQNMGEGIEILRLPELTEAACPVAAIILRGCGDRVAAERLLDYLSSDAASKVFRYHGFSDSAQNSYALERPDYEMFGEAGAVRFNRTAKARPVIYTRLAEYLVERFDLSARKGIGIEIGGGPGDLILDLAKSSRRFYWVNTDINTWYARPFAEDALKQGLAQNTGFVFADACALPFKDDYADLAFSRGSYQFWGSLEKGLREAYRVLKPGGWAFIGRGFPPSMPEDEVRILLDRGLAGGPKYDPDKDAVRFRSIINGLGVNKFEVIRHQPTDTSLNYGVWLCFQK